LESDKLTNNDLFFQEQYLPIILIYNKDFIIKLLQIKACNVFYNYKINFPDSFLLDDIDINKYAATYCCFVETCQQHNILSLINKKFYEESFDYFLEQNPNFIFSVDSFDFGFEIVISEKHLRICLNSRPSLHKIIDYRYGLPRDCKTIEYVMSLIDRNICLNKISIDANIESLELYNKAVEKNGLNIKYVPTQFITDHLVKTALANTKLALLVIPTIYIKYENLDDILEYISMDYFESLNLNEELYWRFPNLSINTKLILEGPINTNNMLEISKLFKSDRNFLLKYVKYRNTLDYCLPIEIFIEDYEILSNIYYYYDDYLDKELDKTSYMKYLIKTNNKDQIKKLITYKIDYTIDMLYDLILLDRSFIIYFDEKYWDGVIFSKYEQYKIKNTKNYMYLYVYLTSRSIDSAFISQNVLSFLTNNYKYNLI
jgi:hypothetical protein